MDTFQKLEMLERLLPYVSDDDEDLNMVDFAQVIADRVREDLDKE